MNMVEISNTLALTALETEKSCKLFENGIMIGYTFVLPQTSAANATLTIKDKDGYTVYTGDAKNDNATYTVMGLTVPMGYEYTATVTFNIAVGDAYNVPLKLYIDTRNSK